MLLWGNPLAGRTASEIPKAKEFRKLLLKQIRTYPRNGTFGYYWPKGKSSWGGTTQDLFYEGKLFAKGDPRRRSYCCGLTFEVFFLAYRRWCEGRKKPFQIGGMSFQKLRQFQRKWYVSDGDRRGAAGAIAHYRLGKLVVSLPRISQPFSAKVWKVLKKAKKGDFVQFWRANGSGHSAVFLGWKRKGRSLWLQYWSSQKSTRGIGIREEKVGPKNVCEIYIGRVGR